MSPVDLTPLSGKSILITGADGMLGRAFREVLQEAAILCRVDAFDRRELDVTDRDAVLRQAQRKPSVILHCAAKVDADACEREPDECRRVQVGGTENIVALAAECGARVFYPQSVFIFDGRELPVNEETSPSPILTYGRCKLEAEQIVLSQTLDALVVRMAGFFGGEDKDKNFVGKFTRQLRGVQSSRKKQFEIGARIWQPTYTLDLARNTLLLLAGGHTGVYHMGAYGEATFFEVASACVEGLGLSDRIEVLPAKPMPQEPAPRPWRMVTGTGRLDRERMNRQRHWRDALREYLSRPFFDDLRER